MVDVHRSALEQRIQRLEDRAEIIELAYRYAIAVDDRDFATIGSLFSKGAAFDTPQGRRVGREAIVALYREQMRKFGATVHTPNGHVLHFRDDHHASGQVLSHAEEALDGEAYWVALRYDDEYLREDGRWRFQSRTARLVYQMPLRELPDGFGETDRIRWPGTPRAVAHLPEGRETYQRSLLNEGGGVTGAVVGED